MPKYRHAIVTFVDLLGFASKVDSGTPPDAILAMMTAVKKSSHRDAESKKLLDSEHMCISDCMIRAQHLKHPTKIVAPDLQSELLTIAHMQSELIFQGYPVRGAVTHGAIHFKGRTLFGPAYQAAFRLEKRAKFPRIIVAEQVIGDFIGYPEGGGDLQWGGAEAELMGQIRKDIDGEWFVDYLRTMMSEFEHDVEYRDFLLAHRSLILKGMAEHTDVSIREKYNWMKHYHNGVCHELQDKWFSYVGSVRNEVAIDPAF